MEKFNRIFTSPKPVIGMVHIQALPGTPKNKLSIQAIINAALHEAHILINSGIDALMIENMHDVPYLNKKVGPEIVAAMTCIASELRKISKIPMGIQILAAANKEALAVALNSGFNFIRAEGFVFGHLADEGYIDSCAGELLRYRKQIGAEDIAIFTDIKKKHSSHALTTDVDILETAKAADFFLADGVIVTGNSTGQHASADDLKKVKSQVNIPTLIGSGITLENIETFHLLADAFIVGSAFKKEGIWSNPLDETYIKKFMLKINKLRNA